MQNIYLGLPSDSAEGLTSSAESRCCIDDYPNCVQNTPTKLLIDHRHRQPGVGDRSQGAGTRGYLKSLDSLRPFSPLSSLLAPPSSFLLLLLLLLLLLPFSFSSSRATRMSSNRFGSAPPLAKDLLEQAEKTPPTEPTRGRITLDWQGNKK